MTEESKKGHAKIMKLLLDIPGRDSPSMIEG